MLESEAGFDRQEIAGIVGFAIIILGLVTGAYGFRRLSTSRLLLGHIGEDDDEVDELGRRKSKKQEDKEEKNNR